MSIESSRTVIVCEPGGKPYLMGISKTQGLCEYGPLSESLLGDTGFKMCWKCPPHNKGSEEPVNSIATAICSVFNREAGKIQGIAFISDEEDDRLTKERIGGPVFDEDTLVRVVVNALAVDTEREIRRVARYLRRYQQGQ